MKNWIIFLGLIAAFVANASNHKPSKEFMEKARIQYIHYCAACHAKDGAGRDGPPALKGSFIATGPIGGNIHMVITGGPHTRMPAWGLTDLSDQVLADVLTYVRNSWGNDDTRRFGKHAGGIVSPELVKKYRESMPKRPAKKNIQI